jgi:hypothetical protein
MGSMINPLFEVWLDGTRVDAAVSSFTVSTSAKGVADSARIVFQDPEQTVTPGLIRGARLRVKLGYQDDQELLEVFDGLVRVREPLGLQVAAGGLCWQAVLQAKRVLNTWENCSEVEVATDMLAGTGLQLDMEPAGLSIDRFPVHNLTANEAMKQLLALVLRETGQEYRFYVRAGSVRVAPADTGQAASYAFNTGENIIRMRPGKLDMQALESFIVSVQHDQVVEIDGERFFVEEAEYTWATGGRTILQVRAC